LAINGSIYNHHYRVQVPFYEQYLGMKIAYRWNGGDNCAFTKSSLLQSVMRCPGPGNIEITGDSDRIDYFVAGFGCHQYRFSNGSPINGYPVGLPRMSRVSHLNGNTIAFSIDMMNHKDRGNIIGHDGGGETFNYTDSIEFLGEYQSFIYVPKGYAVAFMGYKQGNDWFAAWSNFAYYDGMTQGCKYNLGMRSYFGY